MDPKEFLIRHGEKIAVVLVALLGAWAIYGAITDENIRPANSNAEKIKGDIESIANARNTQQPPILKAAPDHVGDLGSRFTLSFNPQSVISVLGTHPDLGRIQGEVSGYYYIYELNPPQIEVEDKVGVIEVTVSKPLSGSSDDPRVSSDAEAAWDRKEKELEIKNHAAVVGFVLEMQVGGDTKPWQKITELTLEDAAKPYLVRGVIPFEDYNFRASTVAKATGFVPGAGAGSEVLVHLGPYAKKPVSWDSLNPTHAEVLKQFASPAGGMAKIFAPEGEKELLYVSRPSDDPADRIQAGVDVKLALKSVAAALPGAGAAPAAGEGEAPAGEAPAAGDAEAGQPEARILVTKFHRPPNAEGKWVQPFLFKVKPGEKVGKREKVPEGEGGANIPVDFSTPFVLEKVEQARPRIIFWKIEPTARFGGGKGKDLKLEAEEKPYDVAILRNPQANTTLELVKLGTITRPPRATLMTYPDYPAGAFKEEDEFRKNAQTFRQVGLSPAKPVAHAPDTGPLQELLEAGDVGADTDTTYYECADGRLIFWDENNPGIVAKWKRGVTPKAPMAVAPADASEAPTGGAAPAAAPAPAAPAPAGQPPGPAPSAPPKP